MGDIDPVFEMFIQLKFQNVQFMFLEDIDPIFSILRIDQTDLQDFRPLFFPTCPTVWSSRILGFPKIIYSKMVLVVLEIIEGNSADLK